MTVVIFPKGTEDETSVACIGFLEQGLRLKTLSDSVTYNSFFSRSR